MCTLGAGALGVHKACCVCSPTGNLEVESAHALRDGTVTGANEFMPTPTGSSAWECFWGGVCVLRVCVHLLQPAGCAGSVTGTLVCPRSGKADADHQREHTWLHSNKTL